MTEDYEKIARDRLGGDISAQMLGNKRPNQSYPCVVAVDATGNGLYAIATSEKYIDVYDDEYGTIPHSGRKMDVIRTFDWTFPEKDNEYESVIANHQKAVEKYNPK